MTQTGHNSPRIVQAQATKAIDDFNTTDFAKRFMNQEKKLFTLADSQKRYCVQVIDEVPFIKNLEDGFTFVRISAFTGDSNEFDTNVLFAVDSNGKKIVPIAQACNMPSRSRVLYVDDSGNATEPTDGIFGWIGFNITALKDLRIN